MKDYFLTNPQKVNYPQKNTLFNGLEKKTFFEITIKIYDGFFFKGVFSDENIANKEIWQIFTYYNWEIKNYLIRHRKDLVIYTQREQTDHKIYHDNDFIVNFDITYYNTKNGREMINGLPAKISVMSCIIKDSPCVKIGDNTFLYLRNNKEKDTEDNVFYTCENKLIEYSGSGEELDKVSKFIKEMEEKEMFNDGDYSSPKFL